MNPYNGFSGQARNAAQRWINQEIAAGRAKKPGPCCACGQVHGVIDYHAEDYSEPFGPHLLEYPLCFRCHIALHCRFSLPEGWAWYLDMLRLGWTWPGIRSRNFSVVRKMMGDRQVPNRKPSGPPRPVLIFDTMFTKPVGSRTPPAPRSTQSKLNLL